MQRADVLARAHQLLGLEFNDPDILLTALTHSSIADSRLESNERLEFLGDAVLGMVVCEELYSRFSDWLEGDLTKVKSVVVSRRVCARIAGETGLSELLMLGNGMDKSANLPTSVRAAVVEAVIGAIFVDQGLDSARHFILRAVRPHIERSVASENNNNFKSALQQYAQRWLSASPQYETLDEQGPDHSKCFEVCVCIGGERFPSAWGPSKKDAEQEAARRAIESLRASRLDHENGGQNGASQRI